MRTFLASLMAGSFLAALAVAQPRPRYTITNLGSALPAGWSSQATMVSNTGTVTGVAIAPDGTQHAVVWAGGGIFDISQPALGGPNSVAGGINSRGQIVGQAESSD